MPKLPVFFTKFYKSKSNKTTSIAFKKNNSLIFFKRPKLKYITLPFFVVVTIAVSFAFLIKGADTEASWYNDNWQYRKAVTVENTGSGVTNQQVKIEQDTATLITNGQLQSSCQDIRFTDKNGNLLNHRLGVAGSLDTLSYVSGSVSSNQSTATGTSIILSHTTTTQTNQALVVVLHTQQNTSTSNQYRHATAIDYNGDALTNYVSYESTTLNRWYVTEVWVLTNPDVGTYNISVTLNATTHESVLAAMNFTNVDQADPVGATATGDSNDSVSISITTEADGSMLVGGGLERGDSGDSDLVSITSGGTTTYQESTGTGNTFIQAGGGYQSAPTAGATSLDLDQAVGTNHIQGGVIELKASTGGGITGDPCNDASTDFYVLMPEINPGDNTIYMYYGNESATTVESQDAFNQTTFTPNSLTTGSQALTPGAVLWYKFDESADDTCSGGTNDVCDASGQGLNGAESGNVTWQPPDMCVKGTSCLFFDGSDDVVTVTNNEPIDFDVGLNSGLTFSAWVKVNSDGEGSTGQIFYKGTNTYLRTTNEGSDGFADLEVSLDLATTDATATATNGITLNKWHYIAFGYTDDGDDEVSLYIDGKLAAASTNGVGPLASDTNNLLIGGTTTANFHGFIDDVKVRPYERTADEVAGDMNGSVISQGNNSFLTSGLVGYWKLDETSGNASDSSGNATTLTDGSTNTYSVGKFANGTDFESSSTDYFYAADNAYLSITGDLTLSAWVKPESNTASTSYNIVGKWDGTNESYLLQQYGDELRLYIDSSSNYITTTTTNLTTATWYHVLATYDSSSGIAKIFVNGQEQVSTTTGTIPNSIGDDAGRFHIGAEDSSTSTANYYDGLVDSVRVYNRFFEPKEIRDLYNWSPGPIIHYKMDENSGTTSVYDSSGNDNTATMNGTMTSSDWVPGKYGGALDFDGSDDYLYSANQVTLSSITYTAWIKTSTAQPAFAGVMSSTSTGGTFAQMQWNGGTNSIRVQIDNGTPQKDYYASQDLEDGNWHHVGFTYDSVLESLILYIDGIPQSVTKVNDDAIGSFSTTQYIQVGAERLAGTFFAGLIDDARVYNYPLTQKQIINVMNARQPGDFAIGSPVGYPIGYWKFDEGYGTTTNDSGTGGNNGAITGASWTSSGKYDKALEFNGSSDYIEIPADYSDAITDEISISAWIKADGSNFTAYTGIINEVYNSDDVTFGIFGNNTDITGASSTKISVGFYNAGWRGVNQSQNFTFGEWVHVVGTYDGANIKLYLNGSLDNIIANTTGLPAGDDYWRIGRRWDTGVYFDGFIDEVKIYNYALTEDEVRLEYNRGSGIVFGSTSTESDGITASNSSSREYCVPGDTNTCNPPVLEYKFDENTGTTSTYDTSGNGYTGTLSGMSSNSWVPGIKGSALSYDNTTTYVTATTEDANLSTNIYTYSAWIYRATDPGTDLHILDNRDANSDGVSLKITNGSPDTVRCEHNATTLDSTSTIELEKWYYVACVSDSSTLKTYVNGILENSTAISGSIAETTDFRVGTRSHTSPSQYFSGFIDQVRVYTYARTPAQIAWEYNKGAPVAWYKFDECEGTTIYDSAIVGKETTTGNNGTLTIGAGGTNTDEGSCSGGTSSDAWYNGASGKWGSAMSFDGTDDVLTVTNANAIDFDNALKSNISISYWVNVSSDGENNTGEVFDKGTNRYCKTTNESGGYVDLECSLDLATTDATVTITDGLTVGTWHHVVLSYEDDSDDEITVYIDGKSQGSSTNGVGSPSGTDTSSLLIGGDSSNNFDGLVDDFQIYNYALTLNQIKVLYNNGAVRLE